MTDRKYMICEVCRYYRQFIDGESGECRRYPPRIIPGRDDTAGHWPVVNDADWCGECHAKERSEW